MIKAVKTQSAGRRQANTSNWSDRLRPWILTGTVALYVARPLWPSESAARSGDGLPVVMLWLCLASVWILAALVDGRLSLRFGPLDMAVLALVAWQAVASLYSAQHDAARPAINMLWEWIGLGTGYWLIRQTLRTPRETKATVAVMIALAVALAGYGLHQYFVSMPATREMYLAHPDQLLRQEGLNLPAGSVERELFEQRLFSIEPLASFALTNSLAGFLLPWFVIVAGVAMSAGRDEWRESRLVVALLLSILAIASCLILTKSRSAYLATGVALGWLIWSYLGSRVTFKSRGFLISLSATALLIFVGFLIGGLDRQILSEAPKSLGYRLQYWRATWAMIVDHPWLGVGPGNFGDHYTGYKLATASEEIADPHNFLLEIAATAGIPAALLMVIICGLVFAKVFRQRDETSPMSIDLHDDDIRAVRRIAQGAGAGVVLAVLSPLLTGPLIEAPLSAFVGGGIVLVGAVIFWLWYPWVVAGRFTIWLPPLAATCLTVNLLAAGGISFAAVAGNFWLLSALSTNRTEQRPPLRSSNRVAIFTGWTTAIFLLSACYLSAYRPAVVSQSLFAAAAAEPQRAEEYLRKAASIDPLASTPWISLAEIRFRTWQAQPSHDAFSAYEQAQIKAMSARPAQSLLWLRMGDKYLAAHQTLRDQRLLDIALGSFRRAVRLYPNHALQHAKYALALSAAGDRDGAIREAGRAYELDKLTPHLDQKLRPDIRRALVEAGLDSSAE